MLGFLSIGHVRCSLKRRVVYQCQPVSQNFDPPTKTPQRHLILMSVANNLIASFTLEQRHRPSTASLSRHVSRGQKSSPGNASESPTFTKRGNLVTVSTTQK